MMRWSLPAVGILASLTLVACEGDGPTGQVLATVDGKDVTRRDVAAELDAAPGIRNQPGARDQALEAVIQRELLVRIAKRRRIDVSPEYLSAIRQARDEILTEQLQNAVAAGLQPSTIQEARAFVSANPAMFAQRMQVRAIYAPVANETNAATNNRNLVTIDTAVVSPAVAKQLIEGVSGQPIRIERDGQTHIVTIVERKATPITGDQAVEVARQVIRRYRLDAAMEKMIVEERARTAIRYQAGKGLTAR